MARTARVDEVRQVLTTKIAVPLEVQHDSQVDGYSLARKLEELINAAGEDATAFPQESDNIHSWKVKGSGYFDTAPPVVIVDREWFYVRTGIERGLTAQLEQLAGLKHVLDTADGTLMLSVEESFRGMMSYFIQWIMEAVEAYDRLNERLARSSDRISPELLNQARRINYKYIPSRKPVNES